MAGTRGNLSNQPLEIRQILLEAQHRWLRPNEVCEILRNYNIFELTPEPPHKPPGGSLFLFDRKTLRYFRKDGHSWRKKKDGKSVREAHEKLKAGSVDVLHCYYAHGEDNDNFQRRSYWMLDSQLEHIVLVHYRDVKEVDLSASTVQAAYDSSPSTANSNGQTPNSELLEDMESGEDLGTSPFAEVSISSECPDVASRIPNKTGFFSRNKNIVPEQSISTDQPNSAEFIIRKHTDAKLDGCNLQGDGLVSGYMGFSDTQVEASPINCHRVFQEPLASGNSDQAKFIGSENHMHGINNVCHHSDRHDVPFVNPQLQNNSRSRPPVAIHGLSLKAPAQAEQKNESGELKKLDSFGRWMNEEIGGHCDDSLMASDSRNYWNTLDAQNDDMEVSSFSMHLQFDIASLAPSLSQEQLFSICDFSPDWAYSGIATKVLITGSFLGDSKHFSNSEWCCMFGEDEVPVEILTANVLRCQAPLHAPGLVPFYITCSNRLACSEVREFEYREKSSGDISLVILSEPEEMRLQIRFAKMLFIGLNWKWLDCSVEKCEKCNLKNEILSTRNEDRTEWERIEKASMAFQQNCENSRDALVKKLLKDRLYEWLVCGVHGEGRGLHILDDEGQGVIHLAAALGYDWAMGPIVVAGVSPSFRDVHGRTGLHWAAFYGREETVVALLKLGAAPGAVEDPSSKFPGGQTAADFASSRGHKGIAGYLAEADLTSHLSLLALKESVMENVAATVAAEKAVETVEEQYVPTSDGARDRQLSLKGSLAAVRKSAKAASLIQASFRARSFQYRQEIKGSDDVFESPADIVALASLTNKASKMDHFSDYLHGAAVKIQQKYRGWKGRKEYLKIRNRIVKIQAHVRGHQVRKQYKKVIWSVGIVEKAILRWRRRGVGLRGFRAGSVIGDSQSQIEKNDGYEFLRVGRRQKVASVERALARVQSMVRYPEARDQYMRLSTNNQNSKIGGEGGSRHV